MQRNSASMDGKVAWITGCGRGMGRAHALLLAERGADIVVHDVLADEARETAHRIEAMGRRVLISNADVADPAAMRALAAEAERAFGKIDVLVNNAGIGQHRSIEEITIEDFDRMFAIHVKGSFFCGQAVIPGMKERRYGKIVNISSIWGMNGADTASHYCAAKTALLGLTKAWAKELAPWNIHVNAVCPGGVITEMPIKVQGWDKIRAKEKKAFLASAEADFITGQSISPNGGETIVGF